MKILLTGAAGFVGSHILERLVRAGMPVRVLLREQSPREFVQDWLPRVEVASGSLDDPESLIRALQGVTHVVHCAGVTKALARQDYFAVNEGGTRALCAAMRQAAPQLQRMVHISSLSAAGPATAAHPAAEHAEARPVSWYGASKLAGENIVRETCAAPWVILRPPAVYGPRDREFLRLARLAQAGVLPLIGGRQTLSFVYVEDLALAVVRCLTAPGVERQIFNVAHPEIVTTRQLVTEMIRQVGHKTICVPLPEFLFWPVCALYEAAARLTQRPTLVNLQKYRELSAAGWVCDSRALAAALGQGMPTGLAEGLGKTVAWYRREAWL